MRRTLIPLIIITVLFSRPSVIRGQSFPDPKSMDDLFSVMDKAFGDADKNLTPEEEYFLGRAVAANILNLYKPQTQDTALTGYLNRICRTLAINSSQPAVYNGFHVMVLDSGTFNAFATPGGHIYITRGLAEAAPSEDALAAIIAHEMAHVFLKHGVGIINSMEIVNEADIMAQQAAEFAGLDKEKTQRVLGFRNAVTGFFDTMVKSGYSKPQEYEADKAALALLASAGYYPGGLLDILKALQNAQRNQKEGLFSTHPSPAERIANIEREIARYRVNDTRSRRVPRFNKK
ncbi:MAG: M48 family metalloprotease [Treponema sp.]|nr:M48 family metalloprotease [Treponema sp.]